MDNICLSYFYSLLIWSNGDGIMWDFVGNKVELKNPNKHIKSLNHLYSFAYHPSISTPIVHFAYTIYAVNQLSMNEMRFIANLC